MSSSSLRHGDSARIDAETTRTVPETQVGELLDLLDDEYVRDILEATCERARPARELAEHLDASRATVYRRLDRLEAAGLVESTTMCDPDGHHRQQFRSRLDAVTVTLDGDALDATVEVTASGATPGIASD